MNEGYLRQRRNLISISLLLMLAMLGGTKVNPLYPFHLDRPFVAEMFIWIGFAYFWYRTKLHLPLEISVLFRNEVIIRHVKKYYFVQYCSFELSNFIGTIDPIGGDKSKLAIIESSAGGSTRLGKQITLARETDDLDSILTNESRLKNIFEGTIFTDYVLPNLIAILTLVIGFYYKFDFFYLYGSETLLAIYLAITIYDLAPGTKSIF